MKENIFVSMLFVVLLTLGQASPAYAEDNSSYSAGADESDSQTGPDTRTSMCVQEGEAADPVLEPGRSCCKGLVSIPASYPYEGGCKAAAPGVFTCTRCEDGECGTGETWCNCPDDCSPPARMQYEQGRCGDSICQAWETIQEEPYLCVRDCKTVHEGASGAHTSAEAGTGLFARIWAWIKSFFS
ncbi:hypothetical protein GF351_01965 [Candidatus Woesearchaeota archaeon]|nr:hypothetical protein [Candidatus Woesearchaeota archaeon]